MAPATRLVLLIGWLGYALMPWYLVEGMGLADWGWLAAYPFGKAGTALALVLSGQAPWLLPPGLALVAASLFWGSGDRRRTARVLIWAGVLGLLLFFAQAFAIVLKDQGIPWLAALLGGAGATQRGIGGGAFLTLLCLLFLLCHGLAYRGACRGDLFTVSTIGLIVLLIGIFIFFPVAIILKSALVDQSGAFAPAAFVEAFFDPAIWGLGGCVSPACFRTIPETRRHPGPDPGSMPGPPSDALRHGSRISAEFILGPIGDRTRGPRSG